MHSQKIKLCHWNANSISGKIIEFYEFLNDNKIDVACLNETCLKPHMNLRKHPDFKIIRFDRTDRPKGGVAIIIKKAFNFEIMESFNTKLLETVGIKLNLSDGSKIEIMSCYLPGGAVNNDINSHFINDLRILTNRNTSYFLLGDFNCRH
jgi:exonuclease III